MAQRPLPCFYWRFVAKATGIFLPAFYGRYVAKATGTDNWPFFLFSFL
jgi:hypothetical protein